MMSDTKANGHYESEIARLRAIIGALVEDMGGEAFLWVGKLAGAPTIEIRQEGEGRDDEITITCLYDAVNVATNVASQASNDKTPHQDAEKL
jgi:hypothetical protein